MKQSDIPTRFKKPFANAASASYIRSIPDAHVAPSGSDAPASLEDGFPPECFSPISSGGIPPNGKDFNGLLKRISEWSRWQAAGMPGIFDATFCTAIGGYPKGAMLVSATPAPLVWISTADDNTTDPNSSGRANWEGVISTAAGKIEIFASSSVPVGYLECNGAAISRTTYVSLFAAIGTTYGVGDGSTTFNVPDLRGEFIRGWDNGRGVDPGRSFGSYQGESLKAHRHVLSNYRAANAQVIGPTGAEISTVGTGSPVETSDTGGAETRPRNIAFLVCIKV